MKYWLATIISIGVLIFIFFLGVGAHELSEKVKSKRFRKFLNKFSNFIEYYFDPILP